MLAFFVVCVFLPAFFIAMIIEQKKHKKCSFWTEYALFIIIMLIISAALLLIFSLLAVNISSKHSGFSILGSCLCLLLAYVIYKCNRW